MLWKMPAFLKDLLCNENAGVEVLGPKGPWLVERIAGMREFPKSMDVDGKVLSIAMRELSIAMRD